MKDDKNKEPRKKPGPKPKGNKSQREEAKEIAQRLNQSPEPPQEPEEDYRECDTEHLRPYPGCFEECDHDSCIGTPIQLPSPEETTGTPEPGAPGAASSSPEDNTEKVAKPLTVEVHFPTITDLRQVVTIDKGTLVLEVKYKVKLETGFELFRLANLLKHQGTGIYATLGSHQVAMDFAFHPDEKSIDVITPEEVLTLQEGTKPEPDTTEPPPDGEEEGDS